MSIPHEKPVGILIKRASFGFFAGFLRVLRPFDIAPELWSILNELSAQDNLTQAELAGRMDKDQTNLGRNLDKLEAKGLIARRRDPADRRAFRLSITEEGRALRARVIPGARKLQEAMLEGLTDAERAVFRKCLTKVIENGERLSAEREADNPAE